MCKGPTETEYSQGHGDDDGPNTCGRGIVKDWKRTIGTWWVKEFTNFNQKTIAVSFFIFFATVAPAITFGAVFAKSTNNYIGPIETVTGTAWVGLAYSIFGGQPMMINGGTGPILAFTTVLYGMAESLDVPFLPFNAWTGLWCSLLLLLGAFFDLNKMMDHLTRFTDEIFALLIAFIFILDAVGNPLGSVGLYWYFTSTHKSHDEFENEEDYSVMATALLSMILGLGTCGMAFFLRGLKSSPYFTERIRTNVFDFAVVLSIVSFTALKALVFSDIETETLNVPDSFAPTFQCCDSSCHTSWPDDCPDQTEAWGRRPWLVDLFDLNGKGWVPIFAIVPAMLAFILIFLDDGITWHLINHPSNKLSHGAAFNYDTVVIAVFIAVNSIIGFPWLVAATVQSIIHVHALAEFDDNRKIVSVHQTRLTHFFIHVLMAGSILILNTLKIIPVPVLYGVFLFMGVAALSTNQFWLRFTMLFMQPSKYPQTEAFAKYLKPKRIHLYTAFQIFLFVSLMVFRSIKVIAIAFPIIIKACIPIRMYVLPYFFTEEELVFLDDKDEVIADLASKYEKEKELDRMETAEDGSSLEEEAEG